MKFFIMQFLLSILFENKVLSRIFGPKRDEVMGESTKLHNEELHDLYSSPCIIRMVNKICEQQVSLGTH
jgi:hypothetical protein